MNTPPHNSLKCHTPPVPSIGQRSVNKAGVKAEHGMPVIPKYGSVSFSLVEIVV